MLFAPNLLSLSLFSFSLLSVGFHSFSLSVSLIFVAQRNLSMNRNPMMSIFQVFPRVSSRTMLGPSAFADDQFSSIARSTRNASTLYTRVCYSQNSSSFICTLADYPSYKHFLRSLLGFYAAAAATAPPIISGRLVAL